MVAGCGRDVDCAIYDSLFGRGTDSCSSHVCKNRYCTCASTASSAQTQQLQQTKTCNRDLDCSHSNHGFISRNTHDCFSYQCTNYRCQCVSMSGFPSSVLNSIVGSFGSGFPSNHHAGSQTTTRHVNINHKFQATTKVTTPKATTMFPSTTRRPTTKPTQMTPTTSTTTTTTTMATTTKLSSSTTKIVPTKHSPTRLVWLTIPRK